MKLRHFLARSIQRFMNLLGYTVMRTDASHITMEAALRATAQRGHGLRTVLDVGASDGNWSELAMKHLKSCSYLLVEAQSVHVGKLQDFCSRHPNATYALVAAGERKGSLNFDASDPFGGQASSTPFSANNSVVDVAPLDDVVEQKRLSGPYLVKLDTHGFEVPILKGARRVLEQTDVLIIECYNFSIAPESLLFYEMCGYLRERGFRCIDLVAPLHRPLDNSFWQMDLVFVRETRPEFKDPRFRQDP